MQNSDISKYITSLNYDLRKLIAVDAPDEPQIIPEDLTNPNDQGLTICNVKEVNFNSEFKDQVITSVAGASLWAGNLVHIDKSLVNGSPTDVKLDRGPVTLHIDLPGLGDKSSITVENPSFPNVSKEIDKTVDHWINNVSKDNGYHNKSVSSLTKSVSYSNFQLFSELGINYKSLATSLSSSVGTRISSEKKSAVAFFQQIFFSVNYETPNNLSSVFSDQVSLEKVKQTITNERPAGYISTVNYGRLLFLCMETDISSTDTDIKFTLERAVIGGSIATENQNKINNMIKNSSFSMIVMGGDVVNNSKSVNVQSIDELSKFIEGERLNVLSKTNIPVPISYNVKDLRDSALAVLHTAGNYKVLECVRHQHGWIAVRHKGAYVAHFAITWQEHGKSERTRWDSGNQTSGYSHKIDIPPGSKDVRIDSFAHTGLVWNPVALISGDVFDGAPNKTLIVWGTTLNRGSNYEDKY
ncbi:MAG: thiol-activated cytolysin family protein [Candidatus Xenolissoclinum pacificiensis L6]|uniref:Thiol-activated cytolysin family protein n=1 Tax=Candidatus Xenolissoclinum pacificiensis L6 TaxID=1401685 RepID=W2V1A7_9RICK|nr:MAG: thiol-activated cytolysin family protein [Candidatus Xenolissoclinum pacificiensis L6]